MSSLNGAGHFRRILAVAERALGLGHTVSLTVGQPHLGLDPGRIRAISSRNDSEVFFLSAPLGLEGPQWGKPSSQAPNHIPSEIRESLVEADFIVSDNSVWPLQLSESTILMAQFLWLDYWRRNNSDEETALEKVESSLCKQAKVRLASPSFQIESESIPESRTLPLKLFRYPYDLDVGEKPTRKEIWLVGGTTGLNRHSEELPKVLPGGFDLVPRETFLLSKSSYRPAAVMGRPGLGSIRDALGSGIPFLPLWTGEDFELAHNSKVLADWNLVWPDWNSSTVSSLFRPTLEADLLETEKHVAAFVDSEFVTLDEAVKQILNVGESLLND